jgi:hypothetical protein
VYLWYFSSFLGLGLCDDGRSGGRTRGTQSHERRRVVTRDVRGAGPQVSGWLPLDTIASALQLKGDGVSVDAWWHSGSVSTLWLLGQPRWNQKRGWVCLYSSLGISSSGGEALMSDLKDFTGLRKPEERRGKGRPLSDHAGVCCCGNGTKGEGRECSKSCIIRVVY